MHQAGSRSLTNGSNLQDDIAQKAFATEGNVLDGKGIRGGGDQLDAAGNLRRERADEGEEEEPEDERLRADHAFTAAMIAGTISNRSPTMP